jgi:O-antigen ligase
MLANRERSTLSELTAALATVAAFAKSFVPFYLVGSTAIFAGTSALGIAFAAVSWRQLRGSAKNVIGILFVLVAFYGVVIVSYFSYSHSEVPTTYLLGILIFHGMFMFMGFAAARALKAVLLVLLGSAAIYAMALVQHAVRFGDVMKGKNIDDIFGISDRIVYISFHQNIGLAIGLGALATIGLATTRTTRALAIGTIPAVLFLLFHIASRTALLSLLLSLTFLGFAACWVRFRKAAFLSIVAVSMTGIIVAVLLCQREVPGYKVSANAPDAISRTIQELQNPNPGFRIPIWTRTLQRIVSEPRSLLFGRGIGMYPLDEGAGPPDWLLNPTEGSKHYPHSVHLELLYATGIVGFVVFSILIILPIVASMRHWSAFSPEEKSAFAIYVFILASSEISGAFAYAYILQFFLALTVGVIALRDTSKRRNPGWANS